MDLTKRKLPRILPHGWKSEVAKALGIHPITVRRNIKIGYGKMFEKIVKTATEKYGITSENKKNHESN